ncbi:MAG: hypothetical protein IBJ00_00650 [Alphaproteobacteria bacterium]|nr:hypothetical protein [Alphaproteobacteria bacterium]
MRHQFGWKIFITAALITYQCSASYPEEQPENKFLIHNKMQILAQEQLIEVFVEDHFTEEMDQLRVQCFPTYKNKSTSRDQFDERSKHIVVFVNNIIAAYGRLTPGPNAVFESWTQGRAQIPTGEDIIDLGRCCVSPLYRGTLLYETIILRGFQYAEDNKFKYVAGGYEVERYLGVRLLKLGFEHSGEAVYAGGSADGIGKTLIQPIVFKIKPYQYDWKNLINLSLGSLHNSVYNNPIELFWKHIIHPGIKSLERVEFADDQTLIQELQELTSPSYEDPSAMINRDLNRCTKLYLLREKGGKLISFFMVGWEPLMFRGKSIQSVFLGLSATCQDKKNSGIVRTLYQRFILDAQTWQKKNSSKLLLWYTTATPSVIHATNTIFVENEPYMDGSYSCEGKELALAIKEKMGWEAAGQGDHPFVLKRVAEATRYSYQERERIRKILEKYHFRLFEQLGIDETHGDRLLRICRVPSDSKAARL